MRARSPSRHALLPLAFAAALLAGCAATAPAVPAPVSAAAPAIWYSPLPHGGQVARLQAWWQQFDDPLLARLVAAAQQASPGLATAKSRIEQARASRVASGAALLPSAGLAASGSRGRPGAGQALATQAFAGLDMAWEIDRFGAGRAGADAAQARLDAARADWHDARVAVAAEAATSYLSLRACEARLLQAQVDASSRHETLRLNTASAVSGMQSPGNVALSRASAAQGDGNLLQQRAQCELHIKALVALTAMDEPALRRELVPGTARLPQPQQFAISSLPADVLAQRPDLFSAARAVEAAGADARQSDAQRYPRVRLTGNIGRSRSEGGGTTVEGSTWSFGPVSVSLPLFDGGLRRANSEAARARYEEAAVHYQARLRAAVREVEEALIGLQSTADRAGSAAAAAEGFAASFRATDARYRGGMASLFELEDARRSDVQAQMALVDLQRERVLAWVTLYRAAGGGWEGAAPPVPPNPDNPESPR